LRNYASTIIADVNMQQDASTSLLIPANYSTFIYVLEGNIKIGEEQSTLDRDQVGWLDRLEEKSDSELILKAGASGARFVIYSGEPQGDPIVSHGPFIADTQQDIQRLYREYREGKMKHISTVSPEQRIMW
jgi:redox-sensitive bicupin YhaK (pirin superfamily)